MSPKTIGQLVVWFALRDEGDAELAPSDDGISRSEVLPGLWLQPSAIWANDVATLIEIAQLGITSPAHGAFVRRLNRES